MNEFCSITNLTPSQVKALRDSGLIGSNLPADQGGRARLLQALKAKGIPLSKLAHLKVPPAAAFVIYDHSGHSIDAFMDPGSALARAVACRGACAVALVDKPAED